jgi:hypothetical protein
LRIAWFSGLSAALFVMLALGLSLIFPTHLERQAVAVSGAVALVVQIVAFALLWRLRRQHVVAAWSLGIAMRFAALAAAALLVVPHWGLPANAALCSLVIFFFVSILLEPWLLRS